MTLRSTPSETLESFKPPPGVMVNECTEAGEEVI